MLQANILRITTPLRINNLTPFSPENKPKNVAICLSGGGARALTAGMGQLRALKTLQDENEDLISQTRCLSTVSGGSWVGCTFIYLPDHFSDESFLGIYTSPTSYTVDNLSILPQQTIGYQVTEDLSLKQFGLKMVLLALLGIPKNDIWKILVGNHILAPYGLYQFDKLRKQTSKSFFSYDQQTLSTILAENPQLENRPAFLVNNNGHASRRPYLICNMSMFVNQPDDTFQYLVPVQATPFFTGILSSPAGVTDDNGQTVGGGAVESFAFNSNPKTINSDYAIVNQNIPFSLADAISTSSAFYAEFVENFGKTWRNSLTKFVTDTSPIAEKMKLFINAFTNRPKKLHAILDKIANKQLPENDDDAQTILSILNIADQLIPEYQYWSVNDTTTDTAIKPSHFADGGDLENTGIAGALFYEDIERVIAFINCATALQQGQYGVLDANEQMLAGTEIIVDSQLPPLFGYRPYDPQLGYQLYKYSTSSRDQIFRHNQIFPAEAFPQLLLGLWRASGNAQNPGSNQHGANFKQSLTTIDNPWFGIAGGRVVTVLWVYNNFINDWYEQLSDEIKNQIFMNNPSSYYNFPHYQTADIQLTPQQVNLLAGQAAWNVAEGSPALFLSMYQE